jgi:ribosomal protein S12 methylthiotransferase accessory factor
MSRLLGFGIGSGYKRAVPTVLEPLREGLRHTIARAVGVTRVARVTGLDRTGVEVATAIRPAGHVLQVSNGKGDSFAAAAAGAVLEALELHAAERTRVDAFGTAEALAVAGHEVIRPERLDGGVTGADRLAIAWRAGRDLATGEPVLVPAHAVHCPPADAGLPGPAVVRWTSNGMGAHPDPDAALLHALQEAAERDRLARALPEGFAPDAVAALLVAPRTLPRAAPRTAARVVALERKGFRVFLLDVGSSFDLPVAAAVLVDPLDPAVPVAAGYACRLRRDDALEAALLEACQSRLTEIHGAREDVSVGGRDAALPLVELLASARARRSAAALPDVHARSPRAGVRAALAALARAGGHRVAAVPLDAPAGVHVVKVVAEGLLVSELL